MKYCSNCGKEISETDGFCPHCGGMTNKPANIPVNMPVNMPVNGSTNNKNGIVPIVCFIIAGLILILSLIACIKISGGAQELSALETISGDTIDEAYYNECGTVYGGFAMFVMAFGLFASGILSYLGYKDIKK